MNHSPDDNSVREEVYLLTESSLRGEISPQEIERLETLINSDGVARQHYVEYVLQSITLGYWASSGNVPQVPTGADPVSDAALATSAETKAASEVRQRTSSITDEPSTIAKARGAISRWRPTKEFVLGAAVASIALGGWMFSRGLNEKNLAPIGATPATSVAYLTSASGCDWGNSPMRLHAVGSAVESSDDISLYEGMAEFRLANGVFLNVEAPASLVINSSSSLVLLYGKLTLHVPGGVNDFRVIAGQCQFVADDADFGLNHQGNRLEIHTFSGEVRATSSSVSYASDANEKTIVGGSVVADDSGTFGRAVITAGLALSLMVDDSIVKVDKMGFNAVPEIFATKLSMGGALPASRAYAQAVLDSHPNGYWRFEKIVNRHVANEVPDGVDLKVIGNLNLAGQPDDRAAEFRPGGNCYLISDTDVTGTEEVPSYTMEAWVKPNYVHIGGLVSLISDEPEPHASTLELQGSPQWPGSGRFGAKHPASYRFIHNNLSYSGNADFGTDCFTKERYLLRRWQHVAAVKDRSTMQIYLNGSLAGTMRDKSPLSQHSRLAVGQDTFHHSVPRNFVGQIDEVAFYKRALSKEEINTHFQAVNWDGQPPSKLNKGI